MVEHTPGIQKIPDSYCPWHDGPLFIAIPFFVGSNTITKPSLKAFLFSLHSFYEGLTSTRLDIKPFHRHLAVTMSYDMIKFGSDDLKVYLNNQSIVADIGNVYQAPNVSETSKFFAGERQFHADDLEVLLSVGEFISIAILLPAYYFCGWRTH